MAERQGQSIPRDVGADYLWRDALDIPDRGSPNFRIVHPEIAKSTSDDPGPDRAVHYRMHSQSISCPTTAEIDCCVLASRHVLDWIYDGLRKRCGRWKQPVSRPGAQFARLWTRSGPPCLRDRTYTGCSFLPLAPRRAASRWSSRRRRTDPVSTRSTSPCPIPHHGCNRLSPTSPRPTIPSCSRFTEA